MLHLDTRSWFSFHDGVAAPEALCMEASRLGHSSLGLCDVDGTYGLISFYRAALEYRLHPLLGISLTDASPSVAAAASRHPEVNDGGKLPPRDTDPSLAAATVIAADRDGYSQLCALAAARHLEPRFDLATALERLTDHCFVITDQPHLLERLARSIGPRRLRVRVMPDYGSAARARQIHQLKLARRYRLDPVACTDVRFLHPQDQHVHAVLRAIGQNTDLQRAVGIRSRNHYLAAPVELPGYYFDCPEALEHAGKLAERCNVELVLDKWQPPISLGERDPVAVLRQLCLRGAEHRQLGKLNETYRKRLEHEIAVIGDHGFVEYFLLVHDLLQFARRERIPYLGRGSAGNSLVSYLLGITPVDPIEQNMLFERFINPHRKNPPDVDIDFASDRRDEVLRYLYSRWGEDRVAMICTLNRFQSRGALREVAKVFGLDDREISKVTRMMPSVPAGMLPRVQARYAEMRGVDLNQEPFRRILPLAARLDGVPHHVGVHAAGVVVAPTRTTDFTGLQRSAEGLVITQYDMHDVERVGLIKLDILGNCGLQALDTTLRSLERRGIHPPIEDWKSLVRDERTQRSLAEGRTMGCFYVESPAMLQLQRKLNPASFEDLTIATSIIRPGVAQSGMMDEYIRRVKGITGHRKSLYTHPLLEKLLPETKGVMVFQEDVIHVGMKLAGLSAADADILRRSMSGKGRSPRSMAKIRENFLQGCRQKHKIEYDAAAEIWRQVASFAGYSFCKSHSACFSVLSYQVIYLKEHHPADYMAAVLSHDGGFYGNSAYISECRRMGLGILPPDVNHSDLDYRAEVAGAVGEPLMAPAGGINAAPTNEPNAIRVSLSVIGNVRETLKERIVAERERAGRYRSLPDFIRRCRPHKAELDILVQCGALDSLGASRPELQWQADREFAPAQRQSGSDLLPLEESGGAPLAVALRDYDEATRLKLERQHLGMLISRHPLELVAPPPGIIRACELEHHVGRLVRLLGWRIADKRVNIGDRAETKASLGQADVYGFDDGSGDPAVLASSQEERLSAAEDIGLIRPGNIELDRPGNVMKFLSMEDLTGRYEVVAFPRVYQRIAPLSLSTGPFIVEGTVKQEHGECIVDCSNLILLDE